MKICIVAYDKMAIHSISLLSYLLNEYGYKIDYVSKNKNVLTTKEGALIIPTCSFEECDLNDYEGIIIPGGITDDLFLYSWLKEWIQFFDKNNKIIGSICAGTNCLFEIGFLNNRRYTSSFDYNSESNKVGNNIKKPVVIDNNLITARGRSFIEFTLEILSLLKGIDESQKEELTNKYGVSKYTIDWELKEYDKNNQ